MQMFAGRKMPENVAGRDLIVPTSVNQGKNVFLDMVLDIVT